MRVICFVVLLFSAGLLPASSQRVYRSDAARTASLYGGFTRTTLDNDEGNHLRITTVGTQIALSPLIAIEVGAGRATEVDGSSGEEKKRAAPSPQPHSASKCVRYARALEAI
ncbi:MAG: hypothetical protein AAF089_03010 [Bacteroidota bacterium]